MEQGILDFLFNQLSNNGVFFALFLYMFYTGKKESKEREAELRSDLKDNRELLNKFAEKYDIIIERLDRLEGSKSEKKGE